MKLWKIVAACGLSSFALANAASAQTAVGLVGDKTLVIFDVSNSKVMKKIEIAGVGRLHGIDLRPMDKKLYGVGVDGTVVTIDPMTGKSQMVVKLDKNIPDGTRATVDFNPAADKLRFMASDGTNLRADLATGKVTTDGSLIFVKEDMHANEKANVVAGAYSNSYGKPEKTALYDVDATIGALLQQVVPNDGTLKAIGKFGIDGAKTYALDIYTTSDGENTAWLVADNTLYTVDLMTGKADKAGQLNGVTGAVRDIAVLPQS